MKDSNYYTSRTLKERVAELYGGRVLTDAQLVTGLRSGVLTSSKVGNARIYDRKVADQWLERHVRPSTTNDQAVRVSTKRLPKGKRYVPSTEQPSA